MNILFVDDDHLLGRTLDEIISNKRPAWEFTWTSNGSEAVQRLNESVFDLLILDILMPIMNGLEVLKLIRQDQKYDRMPIILATCINERETLRLGMELGADDFLTKPYTGVELIAAAEARMRRFQARDDEKLSHSGMSELTPREIAVLRLIAKGLVSKEIAVELGISLNTVGAHKTNIMHKLDLHTSSGLAAFAVKFGLT